MLKNAFNKNVNIILPAIEIRKLSAGLENKTYDNYLGKSEYAKTVFTRDHKTHLIGLYVEKLQLAPEDHTLYPNHNQVLQMLYSF